MSDTAVRVDNLSKVYRIGTKETQSRGLARAALSLATAPFSYLSRMRRPPTEAEILWALRDISFELKHGEVLGIIGRNGAGKSTLLKILSRITEPSSGHAQVFGRVGSLLEVGTGFHPELTGRENIYLNGAILGMKRAEIWRKFDEIVDFSGVERFLDTPVKRYSSGMYVRLAFAVAAHLEPEILIIDEVLAVGDAEFQRRCLGKMKDAAGEGRAILFVSHNMLSVRSLCSRGILLDSGNVAMDSSIGAITQRYMEQISQQAFDASTEVGNSNNRRGNGAVRYSRIDVEDDQGNAGIRFKMGDNVRFVFSAEVFRRVPHLFASLTLRSGHTGDIVTNALHELSSSDLFPGQTIDFVVNVDSTLLRPGEYDLYLWLGANPKEPYDVVDSILGPLVIYADGQWKVLGFDPFNPVGYFSLPTRLEALEIHDNHNMVPG